MREKAAAQREESQGIILSSELQLIQLRRNSKYDDDDSDGDHGAL